MLTTKDIQKLTTVFATKDEVRTFVREEVSEIREVVQGLVTGIDGISKKLDDIHHEYVALKISDNRQNSQIQQLADHTKIKFL